MPVHMTERNFVTAYEPLPDDMMVRTIISGGDGSARTLSTQHIDQYKAAVDWAVSMADQFEHPVHVVPISAEEYGADHGDALQQRFDAMTPDERRELRQEIVRAMATVMRDCGDTRVRADAFDVLVQIGAVRA
jgi:hypothetical protein